jgi:hypothetical protein
VDFLKLWLYRYQLGCSGPRFSPDLLPYRCVHMLRSVGDQIPLELPISSVDTGKKFDGVSHDSLSIFQDCEGLGTLHDQSGASKG